MSHAYSTYSQGIQDPFFQQWQHANAQPQSTGAGGSSTSVAIVVTPDRSPSRDRTAPAPRASNLHGSGSGNPGIRVPCQVLRAVRVNGLSAADTERPLAIRPQRQLGRRVGLERRLGAVVLARSHDRLPGYRHHQQRHGDSGPSATAVTDLTVDVGATLEIVDGGLLTVCRYSRRLWHARGRSTRALRHLHLQGPVIVETSGTIEAIGSAATIYFADTTPPPPGSYTVDNNGVIAADSGATVFFEQATTKNESGAADRFKQSRHNHSSTKAASITAARSAPGRSASSS